MKRCIVILVAGVWALAVPAHATIINIPDDQPTIQAGIDASVDGDTVLVQPGRYVENIIFNSWQDVILGSLFLTTGDTGYISSTIIDGNSSGPAVMFVNGGTGTAICGFTIQNGYHGSYGGGISCINFDPTISYNIIKENSGGIDGLWGGGGIWCNDRSSPIITHNIIKENEAFGHGGGIYCRLLSNPLIRNNIIVGNSADFRGGAIYSEGDCNPIILNNTIVGNSAVELGGGIYCPPTAIIMNSIIWANIAGNHSQIYGEPDVSYSDIQDGWEGEGNIDCDPMFCYPDTGNYYLAANSCCVGAGEGGVDIGALGIGCTAIPTLTEWGMIILGLLLLAAGTIAMIHRRKEAFANEH